MKYIFKLSLVILLVLTFNACNEDETINDNTIANKEMIEILHSKYGIETTILDNGSFEFKYLDGRTLSVFKENEKIIFTGSKINNEQLIIESFTKDEALKILNSESDLFLKSVPKQQFIKSINNFSNLNSNLLAKVNSPCDEHASNEEFDDCVEREVDEFCDGLVGCLALATNPVIIIGIIAIHCAAC